MMIKWRVTFTSPSKYKKCSNGGNSSVRPRKKDRAQHSKEIIICIENIRNRIRVLGDHRRRRRLQLPLKTQTHCSKPCSSCRLFDTSHPADLRLVTFSDT
ncbi:hypothetical protein Dimus_038978 [Dionaea muscipula]